MIVPIILVLLGILIYNWTAKKDSKQGKPSTFFVVAIFIILALVLAALYAPI